MTCRFGPTLAISITGMEHANCPATASAELYAMKRLDPFARKAFELHVTQCPSCMRIVLFSDEFSPLLECGELGPLEVELLRSG